MAKLGYFIGAKKGLRQMLGLSFLVIFKDRFKKLSG